MKKLFVSLFTLCALNSSAQIGIKILQFRPVGEFGMIMSKAITGEIMYLKEFDDRTRSRFGLSYISFKPRLDTFPVYAIQEDGNGTTVLPGYQVFHKYNMTYLFGGMDWAFLDKETYFVYAGFDIMVGGVDKTYDLSYETFKDESFDGGELLGGIRLRLGGEYMLNENAGLFLELSRAFYLIQEDGLFSNNDIGIGFQYIFN